MWKLSEVFGDESVAVCESKCVLPTQVCSGSREGQQCGGKNSMTPVRAGGDHVGLSRRKNPVNELRVGAAQSDLCSL